MTSDLGTDDGKVRQFEQIAALVRPYQAVGEGVVEAVLRFRDGWLAFKREVEYLKEHPTPKAPKHEGG